MSTEKKEIEKPFANRKTTENQIKILFEFAFATLKAI